MNILIGVCGFGNGHSLRQAPIIERMLAEGHRVAVLGSDASYSFFHKRYGHVPLFRAWAPKLWGNAGGLDFSRIAEDPGNRESAPYGLNFETLARVHELFGAKTDLVISDFEPLSAQYAYATSTPLVTFDNQSLALGCDLPVVDGYTQNADRARLSLYFPKAAARIVACISRPEWPRNSDFPIRIVPPVVRKELPERKALQRNRRTRLLVYVSPFFRSLDQTHEERLRIMSEVSDCDFTVFGTVAGNVKPDSNNIAVEPFDVERFAGALAESDGVISTAGFSLLSEAVHLGTPAFVTPFPTHEQHLNARVVADLEIGVASAGLSVSGLRGFVDRLPEFASNLKRHRREQRLLDAGEGCCQVWRLLTDSFPRLAG